MKLAVGAVPPGALAPQAASDPFGQSAPTTRVYDELVEANDLQVGDRIDGAVITEVYPRVHGVEVELEHGTVDDRFYADEDGLIAIERTEHVEPVVAPKPAVPEQPQRHTISYHGAGGTCSCGQEFNVYKTNRRGGWSEAHDGQRTTNIVKANARRHAEAANRKLAAAQEPEQADPLADDDEDECETCGGEGVVPNPDNPNWVWGRCPDCSDDDDARARLAVRAGAY